MRSRADRASDALAINIAEVLLRQSLREERVAQQLEPRSAPDGNCTCISINGLDTLQIVQRDQHILGLDQRHKRMARADDPYVLACTGASFDKLDQFIEVLGGG